MSIKKVPARTKRAIQPQAPVLLPRYAQWEWVYTPSAGINNLGSTKIAAEFVNSSNSGGSTKAGKSYTLGTSNVAALRLGDSSCKFTQTKPVSGLIVFKPTVSGTPTALFIASAANAGLYVKVSSTSRIAIDTAGSANILAGAAGELVINDINVVAFCIEPRVVDGGSGRISYAINGKLVTSTWTAAPAFNAESHFGTGQNSENNVHQQMLSCASTASISNAELVALSNDPWQIFQQSPAKSSLWLVQASGTISRPNSDIVVSGWSGDPDNVNLYANIDEATASDTDFVLSPNLNTPAPAIFGLSLSLAAGTYDVRTRARRTDTTGDIRALLLDSSGATVGTSAWQTVTGSFANYTLSVTTTGTATRIQLEVRI